MNRKEKIIEAMYQYFRDKSKAALSLTDYCSAIFHRFPR